MSKVGIMAEVLSVVGLMFSNLSVGVSSEIKLASGARVELILIVEETRSLQSEQTLYFCSQDKLD